MTIVQAFRRLAFLVRRPRFDRELDAEIAFHIDSRADDLVADGMARDVALEQARREFGSEVRARERTRAAWQICWLEDCLADLRYAIRGLRRSLDCSGPLASAPASSRSRSCRRCWVLSR